MKFHNCNVGIFARNGSTLDLNVGTHYIRNCTVSGLQLESNSFVNAQGTSGSTGSSIVFETTKYGVSLDASRAIIETASFENCDFSIYAKSRSFFSAKNGYINYGGTASTNAGLILDMNSVGSAYGMTVTGHTTGTAGTSAATFKVVNDSILYVGTTAHANLANITPYGVVRIDTYQGLNAGGFLDAPTASYPSPSEP